MTEQTPNQMKQRREQLPPGVARYKPLPAGWKASNYYWCYGWPITEGMIQEFLIKRGIPVPNGEMMANTMAMCHLQVYSGYQHVNFVNGRPDSPEALATGRLTDTKHGVALYLLVISCTSSRKMYLRRPTPRQLEILTELLGEEPGWFETRHTKAVFSEDVLE